MNSIHNVAKTVIGCIPIFRKAYAIIIAILTFECHFLWNKMLYVLKYVIRLGHTLINYIYSLEPPEEIRNPCDGKLMGAWHSQSEFMSISISGIIPY